MSYSLIAVREASQLSKPPKGRTELRSPQQLYLAEINGTPLLTRQQERDLAEKIALGDPYARDHMVTANLRLVVNIAKGFLGRGLSLEDLIAEGNLGLMRAVEGFDGTMEIRFSTYASYWIKQSIRSAVIKQGKAIRLPAYMATLVSKWRRVDRTLTERLGRSPTNEEIGSTLHLSRKRMDMALQAIGMERSLAGMENAHADGEESVRASELADQRSKAPGDLLVESDDLERILHRIEELDDREAAVVRMRFGLGNHAAMTLREIGESLGLTRERVRQLECQALKRLMDGLADQG